MTNSRMRISLISWMIVWTMLACAIPGLAPASLPAPTADTGLLATMVAATFSAALAETANAASKTPTQTLEPPAADTPTLETSAAGSLLTRRDDNSTLFSDRLAGYEVLVPASWLPIRLNEQEYFDALAQISDPAIQRSLTSIQNQDPKRFRLFVLDMQEGHIQGGFVTNVNFLWDEADDMSLADDADVRIAADSLANTIPGLEVLTTEVRATSAGVPIGVVTSEWPATTADGVETVIFQKQVFFKVYSGTVVVTLSTTKDLQETVLPLFDAMVETISILN